MSIVSSLLSDIESFLRESGMAETTFGRLAVNDGKFVGRLRQGAGVTVATVDRVRAYLQIQRTLREGGTPPSTSSAASAA